MGALLRHGQIAWHVNETGEDTAALAAVCLIVCFDGNLRLPNRQCARWHLQEAAWQNVTVVAGDALPLSELVVITNIKFPFIIDMLIILRIYSR